MPNIYFLSVVPCNLVGYSEVSEGSKSRQEANILFNRSRKWEMREGELRVQTKSKQKKTRDQQAKRRRTAATATAAATHLMRR